MWVLLAGQVPDVAALFTLCFGRHDVELARDPSLKQNEIPLLLFLLQFLSLTL